MEKGDENMKKVKYLSSGQWFAEALNLGVLKDHIKDVESGYYKADDLYYNLKKNEDKLKDLHTYICWKYKIDDCKEVINSK